MAFIHEVYAEIGMNLEDYRSRAWKIKDPPALYYYSTYTSKYLGNIARAE